MTDSSTPWEGEEWPLQATVINEDSAWTIFLPGLPIAAQGATLDDAAADTIQALREYASDWEDHLSVAPNHAENRGLVQRVNAYTDEQLSQWLTGAARERLAGGRDG